MCKKETFCTLINCMDGRVQLHCNPWMCKRFDTDYVDTITAPSPVKRLAANDAPELLDYAHISIEQHGSQAIAIAAHPECAGNPVDKNVQLEELKRAVAALKAEFPHKEIIALWVELDGAVSEV